MTRFPTPDHLASWARFAPGISESAGRKKGSSGTGKGNRYLARALGEAAIGVRRTDTFLGERYRRIEDEIAPFAQAVELLDEIPGIGVTAARVIIAEVGVDMTRFPTAAHLCSWARFAPGVKESAGRKKGNGATGHGNRYLAAVLGEAAVAAAGTNTFLGERYRRIARRRGKKKAIVAVGRSILVVVWHLLSDPEARFIDLGADYYDTHLNTSNKKRNHVRQLEALGYKVTLEPAA